jgi:RimJ/RimL family protein N-acetyltransferase
MNDQENIQGERVILRPATPEIEPHILEWLRHEAVPLLSLGPPLSPEPTAPPEEDMGETVDPHYLDGTAIEPGRHFWIIVDGERVGQADYCNIEEQAGRKRVELYILMHSEECCGKDFDTDALDALCRYLFDRFGVVEFMIQPSASNPRAIRAYEKAGFSRLDLPLESARELWGPNDYGDSVYMVRTIL